MKILRYLSRCVAESVSMAFLAAGAFGGISYIVGADMISTLAVMTLLAIASAFAAIMMRLIPIGWEDQSSLNHHMGISQYENDVEEAQRLDRQWFKWW